MMHHQYPLPPAEIQAFIEESRRNGVSEERVAAGLKERGLSDDAVAHALAPAATVVAVAESSVEMIEHFTPAQIWLYGLVLGFPSALQMVRVNSLEIRGQDRMLGPVARYAWAYGAWCFAVIIAFFLIGIAGQGVPPFAVALALLVGNVAFVAVFAIKSVRAEKPFHDDAASRDELAPASVMVPLLSGVVFDLAAYAGIPYSLGLLS